MVLVPFYLYCYTLSYDALSFDLKNDLSIETATPKCFKNKDFQLRFIAKYSLRDIIRESDTLLPTLSSFEVDIKRE